MCAAQKHLLPALEATLWPIPEFQEELPFQQPLEDWTVLEFSQLGFIVKIAKSLDLRLIVALILMFYGNKPIGGSWTTLCG